MTTTTTPTTAQAITIQYDHLKAFDASAQTPQNQALIDCVGRAFGSSPDCLGLIAVQGVPNFVNQRQRLLRLAHALANLPKSELETCERADTLYSVGWSHGREQMAEGRPDTSKGSYYANPWTDSLVDVLCQREPEKATYWKEQEKLHPECYADNIWPSEVALPMFRQAFMELGQLMGETGQLLTAVCDAYCKQEKGIDLGLQKTLTQSMNAKGRLLHYFSPVPEDSGEEKKDDTAGWCGWHNDHGSLTCLAPGMFLDENGNQMENPDPEHAGLWIQARSGTLFKVGLPTHCVAFQIGETSQIQSGGVLQATPHAVQPPRNGQGVTRESFAVFLEPEFEEPLNVPPGKTVDDCQGTDIKLPPTVVPLRKRWKAGQKWGDFHHVTVSGFTAD
mmetsp:Transcript_7875/g.16439  ORF Transcript_7875/g.16439 Transcript_7875/m.16439 type:complete len:391 (+) Transcript_7875:270-1442(+)|eukprot:CAMPEP_0168731110 /NCGR_PEP_ID=MMETSP0724-20121128/7081_1 /TAXON_ID=265536 /ORGANISM="Amphiprora sp., Strain CCMP467" /LENGTH=390 /DNA_ID=CAMNT_0008778077 /DNA_START=277 /DNA_END=1449 /DNA_ORIENTATION=+